MSKKRFGYCRVSTEFQHVDNQVSEIVGYDVELQNIYKDIYSGSKKFEERPELKKLMSVLREGDTLVVYSIDRLSRRIKDVIKIVEYLEQVGVKLVLTTTELDLTTPAGKLILHQFSALAEFELGQMKQRQRLGIERAKKLGKYKGRRSTLTKNQIEIIIELYKKGFSVRKIAEAVKIGKSSVHRIVNKSLQ